MIIELEKLLNDFAIVTYLKGNAWNRHEQLIRAEAMERIHKHGAALVHEEVVAREYTRLKQMVLNFEVQNGLVMANVKAGADIMAGNGGYSIGTKEGHEEFAKNRMK